MNKAFIKDYKKLLFTTTYLIIILFFFNSILLNRNIYNNHVNLIYTAASDFINNKSLYKEIYVKYGIGDVLINSLGLYLFGDNIFSIFLLTNIFYFTSIFIILLICVKLKFSYVENLFIILLLINIHPSSPFAPWPNYLSFLPIIISIYFLADSNKKKYFFSGLSLSIACLIRETILLSALSILFFLTIFFFFTNRNKVYLIKFYIAGFFLPLLCFFFYMILNSNHLIWIDLIFPSYRLEALANLGYFINPNASDLRKFILITLGPFREITLTFIKSIYFFWWDWVLIILIYASCLYCFLRSIIKRKFNLYSIISIYSLSLILQNLHLPEIMRVSTGSIIGLIVLNSELEKIAKNKKILFYFVILLLLFINQKEFYKLSTKNITDNFESFFSKNNKLDNTKFDFEKFPQFKNMNYDPLIHKFYLDFQKNCKKIKEENNIKYSINRTEYWDFNHLCVTKPIHYFSWEKKVWTNIFYNADSVDKNLDATNDNTLEFFNSNEKHLENYKIFYIYDVYDKLDIKRINYLKIGEQKLPYLVNYLDLTYRYILIAKKLDNKL
jgi:hypothetical protein